MNAPLEKMCHGQNELKIPKQVAMVWYGVLTLGQSSDVVLFLSFSQTSLSELNILKCIVVLVYPIEKAHQLLVWAIHVSPIYPLYLLHT